MVKLFPSRNDVFRPCSNEAMSYVKLVAVPSDIWFYVPDQILTIRVIDCDGNVIADYDNEHEVSPSEFTAVLDAYDGNGSRFTYIREGMLFASLGLDCGTCFYYQIFTANIGTLYSETLQIWCEGYCGCSGLVRASSSYFDFDHLGRYYGEPCDAVIRYPSGVTFSNLTAICAELRQVSFTNTRTTTDDDSCLASAVGVSLGYTFKGVGVPDYQAQHYNTLLLGKGLSINDISLLPQTTEIFAPLRDCECLFYLDTQLTTCNDIRDLLCSDQQVCCLTVHVPENGVTGLSFDFDGDTYEYECIADGTVICEAGGTMFGGSLQPTNIALSNGFAWYEYDCNGDTCCIIFVVSRSGSYAGVGEASYQFDVGGVLYGGTFTVTENGNFTLLRMCFPVGTIVTLVSVSADGITTLYPGTGSIIEAKHLDGQNRTIFGASLINECASCDCDAANIAQQEYALPDNEAYIWFVNSIGSPYSQNTVFMLFNSGASRNNFRSFVNACIGDYIRISNGTNTYWFLKANLFFVTQMATSSIPIPITSPIPAGYDYAIQYSYITPLTFPIAACADLEQQAAAAVDLAFLATLSASNNLRFPMTLVRCVMLVDDCGTYPPPCSLQITTVSQSCEAGGINVIVNFLAAGMSGDIGVTVTSAVAPFNQLIPYYETTIAGLSTGFTIPIGTTDDFIIHIVSVGRVSCFSQIQVTPISCSACGDCIADSVFSEILVSGAAGASCTGDITVRYQDPLLGCDWKLCRVVKLLTIGSSYEVYPTNFDPTCLAITVTNTGVGEYQISGLGQGQYECKWRLGSCSNTECEMDNLVQVTPTLLRRCTFFTPDSWDYQYRNTIQTTGGFRLDITSVLINGIEQLTATLQSIVSSLAQFTSESYPLQGAHDWNIWVQFCNNFNALNLPNTRMLYSSAYRLEPVSHQYGGDPFRLEYKQTDSIQIAFSVFDGTNVLQWQGVWDNTPLGGTIVNGTLWSPALYCMNSNAEGNFPCETDGSIYAECNSAPNPDLLEFGFQGMPLQQGEAYTMLWRVNGGAWATPPFDGIFQHVFDWRFAANDPIFVTGFNTVELMLTHTPNGVGCITQTWGKTMTFDNTNPNAVCATVVVT